MLRNKKKAKILLENKGKAGVYCFTNLINGKKYVGSSNNLQRRFRDYFNINYLPTITSISICSALLKFGYSNFSLKILEYCDIKDLLIREDHYFQLLKPEYNIPQKAGSPMLGRTHSKETRAAMSAAQLEIPKSEETKQKSSASQPNAQKIEVFDKETNLTTTYVSIRAAAKALSCTHHAIQYNIKSKNQKPYKGRYVFVVKIADP